MLVIGLLASWSPSHVSAGLSSKETTQRSQEIEKMTAIERDRLQRNWQTFLALPDDRKQHFRQLHQQLENDRKTGNGQLHQTMQTYALWLQTLTPGQRADLRDAKDPALKLELVKKYKEEQDQRQESRALEDPAFDPSSWRGKFPQGGKRPRQGGGKPLDSQELRAAMQALADELPRSEREELEGLDKVRDKWRIYRQVIERSVRQADGPREWPNLQQQQAIRSAIKASEHAERLEKIEKEPLRRMMFARLMASSLYVEIAQDSAPYLPKQADLEDLFKSLDNTEREKLMQLPVEEMTLSLMRKFHGQNKDPAYLEFSKQRREFHEATKRLFRDAQWGARFGNPPGGDRPQFRPGGPPPGGPDEDAGPNRPPRDRGGRPRPPNRPNDREPPPE